MVKYFALFANNGERIKTIVADGMPYNITDVLLAYPEAVEISAEEQELYMKGYIRGKNGMPQEQPQDLDTVKQQQIDMINATAKSLLMETDHDVVEYLELKNLSETEYQELKNQRQLIRLRRDKMVNDVKNADTVTNVKNIMF